jgi:predicted signal transduction protein with EAL and GGDEF domain
VEQSQAHVCWLDGVRGASEVAPAARWVRETFVAPFCIGDVTVGVSASVGEAVWPDGGSTVEALVQSADAAMYRNKPDTRAA